MQTRRHTYSGSLSLYQAPCDERSILHRSQTSGVTRHSGARGQISKSSHPSPFPTLSLPSAPSLSTPSRHSLPSPSSPPYSQPFPSPSLPLITASGSGERYSSPAGPGGAQPPNAFLYNSQPQICKSIKSFTHGNGNIIFWPGTRGSRSGVPGLCPSCPPHCYANGDGHQ